MISPTEDRPQVPRRIEDIVKVSFFYYHHLSQLLSLKLLHGSYTANYQSIHSEMWRVKAMRAQYKSCTFTYTTGGEIEW